MEWGTQCRNGDITQGQICNEIVIDILHAPSCINHPYHKTVSPNWYKGSSQVEKKQENHNHCKEKKLWLIRLSRQSRRQNTT